MGVTPPASTIIGGNSPAGADGAMHRSHASDNQWAKLTDEPIIDGDRVAIGTMHLAKGLEFRAVAVMANLLHQVFQIEARVFNLPNCPLQVSK